MCMHLMKISSIMKTFELSEAMRQRADYQLADHLDNV